MAVSSMVLTDVDDDVPAGIDDAPVSERWKSDPSAAGDLGPVDGSSYPLRSSIRSVA